MSCKVSTCALTVSNWEKLSPRQSCNKSKYTRAHPETFCALYAAMNWCTILISKNGLFSCAILRIENNREDENFEAWLRKNSGENFQRKKWKWLKVEIIERRREWQKMQISYYALLGKISSDSDTYKGWRVKIPHDKIPWNKYPWYKIHRYKITRIYNTFRDKSVDISDYNVGNTWVWEQGVLLINFAKVNCLNKKKKKL